MILSQPHIKKLLESIPQEIVDQYLLESNLFKRVDGYILHSIEWNMEQERTKKMLEKGNDKLLGEIGCRLPNDQRFDFLQQYHSRLDDEMIYDIAEEIPKDNLLEFFRLKLLKREANRASLAVRLPEENILEFFELGQLNDDYYDDNRMQVARKLPSQDLMSFFYMNLLREEENIAELAKKLPETDILEFFQMGLLKDEKNIADVAKRLPDEEFLQFWNLGLVSNLELLKAKIKKIPDELLNRFIDETDDYNLKQIFTNAIRDEKMRSKRQEELRDYEEIERILNSLHKIEQNGTPPQKARMTQLLLEYLARGENDKTPSKQ